MSAPNEDALVELLKLSTTANIINLVANNKLDVELGRVELLRRFGTPGCIDEQARHWLLGFVAAQKLAEQSESTGDQQ